VACSRICLQISKFGYPRQAVTCELFLFLILYRLIVYIKYAETCDSVGEVVLTDKQGVEKGTSCQTLSNLNE